MDSSREYLDIVRSKWKVIVVSAVLTGVVAFVASMALPKSYESEARILVSEPESAVSVFGSALPQLSAQKENPVQTQAELLRSPSLFRAVIVRLGLTESPSSLAKMVKIAPIDQTSVISIVAKAGDAETAARIANALADEYVSRFSELKKASLQQAAEAVESALANAQAELQVIDARAAKQGLSASQATERQSASDRVNALADKLDQLRVNAEVEQAGGTLVDRALASSKPTGPAPWMAGVFGCIAGAVVSTLVVLVVGTRAHSEPSTATAGMLAAPLNQDAQVHSRSSHWRTAGDRRSRPREGGAGDRRRGPVDRRVARVKVGALDLKPDDVAEIEGVWRQVLDSDQSTGGGRPGDTPSEPSDERGR